MVQNNSATVPYLQQLALTTSCCSVACVGRSPDLSKARVRLLLDGYPLDFRSEVRAVISVLLDSLDSNGKIYFLDAIKPRIQVNVTGTTPVPIHTFARIPERHCRLDLRFTQPSHY
jgi:hypothetical protein